MSQSNAAMMIGTARVERQRFGITPGGRTVDVFTVTNGRGTRVRFMDYGGIIQSIEVPDRRGVLEDVTLGFDTLEAYRRSHPYFGALVGRYANRIANGRFSLDGREYALARNDGVHHLHGGARGFDRVLWRVEPFQDETRAGAVLTHTSFAGDEGYPGTLRAQVTYTLTEDDELACDYQATTDAPTPVCLTQHSYFNLGGCRRDVLDHTLALNASRYTPVDATLIPTGELRPVAGTPFDFRAPSAIGSRIRAPDEQLRFGGGGYDHNFVLDKAHAGALELAARLHEPESGRTVEIITTEPGLQLYTANTFGGIVGKHGVAYGPHYGVALETQHFPDSPNHAEFPSAILRPGEAYVSRTVYRFMVSES